MPVTKEQQRSAFALEKITKIYGGTVSKDDANFIVGTPTMILSNGIAQTMAFLLSKQNQREERVFDILKAWLGQEIAELGGGNDNHAFLSRFAQLNQETYLRAQDEALALLQWLKRYARAFQTGGA